MHRQRPPPPEVHDALTSLLAHGKPIPEALTPDIRHQINLLVGGG